MVALIYNFIIHTYIINNALLLPGPTTPSPITPSPGMSALQLARNFMVIIASLSIHVALTCMSDVHTCIWVDTEFLVKTINFAGFTTPPPTTAPPCKCNNAHSQ